MGVKGVTGIRRGRGISRGVTLIEGAEGQAVRRWRWLEEGAGTVGGVIREEGETQSIT